MFCNMKGAAVNSQYNDKSHVVKKFSDRDIEGAKLYFEEYGYVVFENCIDDSCIDRFWSDFEENIQTNEKLTFSVWGKLYNGSEAPLEARRLPRVIDIEKYSLSILPIMLADVVVSFLSQIYNAPPTCIQTLTYKFSSEQGAHSDKFLVSPGWAGSYDREFLTAAWFSFERADERNGALIIYPASHKIPKMQVGQFPSYGEYMAHCDAVCRNNGSFPVIFEANRGDILFWDADFVHAGGAIAEKDSLDTLPTRNSLVCHYARLDATTGTEIEGRKVFEYRGSKFFGSPEFSADTFIDPISKHRPKAERNKWEILRKLFR